MKKNPPLEKFSGIPFKKLFYNKLHKLDLHKRHLGVPEAIVLGKLLKDHATNLTSLDLSGNNIMDFNEFPNPDYFHSDKPSKYGLPRKGVFYYYKNRQFVVTKIDPVYTAGAYRYTLWLRPPNPDLSGITEIATALPRSRLAKLNLSDNGFDLTATEALVDAVNGSSSLTSLNLDGYELPVKELKEKEHVDLSNYSLEECSIHMIGCLESNTMISLNLSRNRIMSEGARNSLPRLFGTKKRLKSLNLSLTGLCASKSIQTTNPDNSYDLSGIIDFAEALKTSSLTSLDLSNNDIVKEPRVTAGRLDLPTENDKLLFLSYTSAGNVQIRIQMDVVNEEWEKGLKYPYTLKPENLKLWFQDELKKLIGVEEILVHIRLNEPTNDESYDLLLTLIDNFSGRIILNRLHEISLGKKDTPKRMLSEIVYNAKSKKALTGIAFTGDFTKTDQEFIKGLMKNWDEGSYYNSDKSIEDIKLYTPPSSKNSMLRHKLFNILCCQSSLQSLNLSDNNLVNGIGALTDALKVDGSLTNLVISRNALADVGVIAIAKALEEKKKITHLTISFNDITSDGAKEIATICGWLVKLDISHNDIKDSGAIAILTAVTDSPTMRELNMSKTDMSPAIERALYLCLQSIVGRGEGRPLRSLNLSKNNIGDKGATPFFQALKSRSSLTNLDLSHTDITKATITQLRDLVNTLGAPFNLVV